MKNLTVKKIALGLFLAGYAASSSFALTTTAETAATILGTAPAMRSDSGTTDHQMTIKVLDGTASSPTTVTGRAVRVGDKVVISYKLFDVDGDTDANLDVAKTLVVYTKDGAGNWTAQNSLAKTVTPFDNTDPEKGEITFTIPAGFAGATAIGLKVQERTQYGDPNVNMWLTVSNLWGVGNPGTGTTDPTNPGAGGGPGDTGGTNPTIGPVETDHIALGIFRLDSAGAPEKGVNYAKSGATNPKYGESYVAIVWDDSDGSTPNGIIDAGEVETTASYSFSWKLTGSYTPPTPVGSSTAPAAVPADTADLVAASQGISNRVGTNDKILLGAASGKHNLTYSNVHSDYKAGAQGYKLSVTAN